jgi:membrane peptidoglycan carboxypeptidase
MVPLHEQKPKLSIFHPREALVRIHSDLFSVHARIKTWSAYFPPALTNLEKMVIVLEDRRFHRHHGVDFKSILRETIRALTFRRHGGASTIDMQLVRTCTGYRERTASRKLYEIFMSVLIQFRYSKIVILRSYLECAYFGSRLRGARSAAKKVFGKRPNDLTIPEAAFLASMLVYPRPHNPSTKWESRVQRRADYGHRVYVAHKKRFDQVPG